MSLHTLGIDAYQLTTLIAHAADGRLDAGTGTGTGTGTSTDAEAAGAAPVGMSFFFRRLPAQRNYVVAAGLRSILEYCAQLRLDDGDLRMLDEHPLLGPALRTEPGRIARAALAGLDGFRGDIDALPEGTLAFAGPAVSEDGKPAMVGGVQLHAYTPLLQVRTSILLAKLIETPWLCRLNYLSMVASKAARIVTAARFDGRHRAVLEFGQRRTHPDAALDAAYAAHLAGCDATSNLAATRRYGIPSTGTMDHFAVQAAERAGVPAHTTEAEFFARFTALFPEAATLLVDTYETFAGIENAVRATAGRLTGVRLDSGVTTEAVQRTRALLRELGVPEAKIVVSDGLDEWRVRELGRAGADGFGIGENITCSPDAATGIGAVGKLVLNGYGKLTMKLARGTGKATLPGLLQAYRFSDHDLILLADEPAPAGGRPLLVPVWRGDAQVAPLPTLAESRAAVAAQIAALPGHLRALETPHEPSAWGGHGQGPWRIVVSARLHETIERLVAAAS